MNNENINVTETDKTNATAATLRASRPPSLKRLAANRRNARKSTGPVTPAGRAISSMNALKHGILSKEVLVQGWNFQEDSQEFSALHARFRHDLHPIGPVEEMLVDQIVTTHWRLRRALAAESGEIALSVDEGERVRRPKLPLLWLKWEASGDPLGQMEDSDWGLELLQRWLGKLRTAVLQDGELTQAATGEILRRFGGKPNALTHGLEELMSDMNGNPESLAEPALRERNQKQALAYLDKQLRLIERKREACREREANEEQARQDAAVLPSRPVVDKILFYETKLERQLYRAMDQLERLQRRRRGEAVPPPLRMEVSE